MNEPLEKNEIDILSNKCERAFLITITYPGIDPKEAEAHLEELESLVDTMGIPVIDKLIVKLKKPQAKYLVGTGKIEEIVEKAVYNDIDLIVFDNELTPSQQRNIEKLSEITVIERREVILDIFADRASTREAVLQVGLARMKYSLPRLTRAWTHLSRQRGGAKGTRGEGETQLEVDRRLVLRKIDHIKKDLLKVKKYRATQRKQRQKKPVLTGSIVGYTNSGKSSLLKLLTDADVLIEDKLFATLDPTTRRIELSNGQEILLTDTVGFIRKLPHDLVEAFKSALEETVLSDVLIHMMDVSGHEIQEHYKTTIEVLKELGAYNKPIITVFNKTDLIEDKSVINRLKNDFPDGIFISTMSKNGIDDLKNAIIAIVSKGIHLVEFKFPYNKNDLVAFVHRNAKVISEKHEEDGTVVKCSIEEKFRAQLSEYLK